MCSHPYLSWRILHNKTCGDQSFETFITRFQFVLGQSEIALGFCYRKARCKTLCKTIREPPSLPNEEFQQPRCNLLSLS